MHCLFQGLLEQRPLESHYWDEPGGKHENNTGGPQIKDEASKLIGVLVQPTTEPWLSLKQAACMRNMFKVGC